MLEHPKGSRDRITLMMSSGFFLWESSGFGADSSASAALVVFFVLISCV